MRKTISLAILILSLIFLSACSAVDQENDSPDLSSFILSVSGSDGVRITLKVERSDGGDLVSFIEPTALSSVKVLRNGEGASILSDRSSIAISENARLGLEALFSVVDGFSANGNDSFKTTDYGDFSFTVDENDGEKIAFTLTGNGLTRKCVISDFTSGNNGN